MKRHLLSFVFGILGLAVAYVAWHLYLDHANHHALVIEAIQRAQQQPAPPPPVSK